MTLVQSILLGIIQGATEFIPISSSGHLSIIPYIFHWQNPDLLFDTILHLGTLVAVLLFFYKDLLNILRSGYIFIQKLFTKRSQCKDILADRKYSLFLFLIFGTIPIAIFGITFGEFVSKSTENILIIALSLGITGFLMWLADKKNPSDKDINSISVKDSIIIGIGQCFSLIRGTSRSGITMLFARILKFKREDAAKLSFLLSIPAIFLAFAYNVYKGFSTNINTEIIPLLGGFIASFIIGVISIKFLLKIINRYGMTPFFIYRISLACILIYIALK